MFPWLCNSRQSGVFSVLSRVAPRPHPLSPNSLPGNSYKHLNDARVGMGHLTSTCSKMTSRVSPNSRALFFRMSDQGFIEETEAHLQAVLGERKLRKVSSLRELWSVLLWREDLCVILAVWNCGSSVLRSVARRRLVETENPSACEMVDCKCVNER
jgi:hypothetical protein